MSEITLSTAIDGACGCGDGLQTIYAFAPDHGRTYPIIIGWCMDCKEIVAYAKPSAAALRNMMAEVYDQAEIPAWQLVVWRKNNM